MKCEHCEEELEEINFSTDINGVNIWLGHKEPANLYVCTSRDCENRGVVIAIPSEPKEE